MVTPNAAADAVVVDVRAHPAPPSLSRLIRPSKDEIVVARRKLHRKAAAILAVTAASYWLLVLAPVAPYLRVLGAAGLIVGLTLVGTGILHDANHGAFSRSTRVNRLFGFTMDLVGGSSLIWRFKHNVLHHGHTNVVGIDRDLNLGPLARLAPEQRWHPWHRYQHFYLWLLYGFMGARWFLGSDLVNLVRLRYGRHAPVKEPQLGEAAVLVLGKVAHFTWAIAIPLAFHPWWLVLVCYVVCSGAASLVLATIFQMAHCVEETEFANPADTYRGPQFQLHQLRTTMNIRCAVPALRPVVRFVMGGLDHQIEHHLAPGLPHTVYPVIAEDSILVMTFDRFAAVNVGVPGVVRDFANAGEFRAKKVRQ
jgi:linoleoyl-CoA desaturase